MAIPPDNQQNYMKTIKIRFFAGDAYAYNIANKIRQLGGTVIITDIFSNFHGHELTITMPTGKGSQSKRKEILQIIDN